MAIKASNQVDLLDMTDGYTVVLTNDNYTFLGTTTAVNGTQTTSTQVMATMYLTKNEIENPEENINNFENKINNR